MKVLFKTLLGLSLLASVSANAQTTQKTATPVKKTTTVAKKAPAKKPATTQNNAAKAAAVAKAKEDSIAAVNALAMQMARKIIVEDSIRKADAAAAQLVADEKAKQEQLKAAEQAKKPEKKSSQKVVKEKKPEKEKVAKAKPEKENVKKVPDELRPTAKPAEAAGDAKVFIGVRGIGLASFVVGKEVTSEFKPLIGYGGGLVANFALGKHFAFQPEALYMQEGFKLKGEFGGETVTGSIIANVVHVPLLLKYSAGEYNRGFFFNVGPYGNYVLNTVTKTSISGTTKEKPDKTIIEYGVAGGLGVAVPVGRGRLLVEARGTFFLGSTEEGTEPSDARIITGGLSVGYLFRLGK